MIPREYGFRQSHNTFTVPVPAWVVLGALVAGLTIGALAASRPAAPQTTITEAPR